MGNYPFEGKKPHLKDVTIAKNYLSKEELEDMNLLVSTYLDFAERQAKKEIPMHMLDWAKQLDDILKLSGDRILDNAGKISKEEVDSKAIREYKKYTNRELSDVENDYIELIKKMNEQIKDNKK